MIKRSQVEEGRRRMWEALTKAGVIISEDEYKTIEVADFGLNNYPAEGAQIVTFVNTHKVGFKLIYLFPGQILPEHWHTETMGEEGKEETFRVIWGQLSLYIPGDSGEDPIFPASVDPQWYSCKKKLPMSPPDTVTLCHDTPHWLKGGPSGCLVYSISSWARCALDPFTNPHAIRETEITED